MALYNVNKGKKWITYHKYGTKKIKNLFTTHILQVLKAFYKNNNPLSLSLSKNFIKMYVFNPFLKPVKDGDLRKSNGSEFHTLGTHTEKALSP